MLICNLYLHRKVSITAPSSVMSLSEHHSMPAFSHVTSRNEFICLTFLSQESCGLLNRFAGG